MGRILGYTFLALVSVVIKDSKAQQTQTITVCETQGPGTITCPLGKEINILNIIYGRTRALPVGTCNPYHSPITNFSCVGGTQADNYVNGQCSGKSKCTLTNSYLLLGDPCSGVPKFLKVDYQCVTPTLPPTTTPITTPQPSTTTVQTTTVQTSTVQTKAPTNVKTYKTTTLAPSQSQITICESKSHTFSCPVGKVLWITHVLWGRLPPSPASLCNPFNTPVSGANCKGGPTARNHVESLCNGKPSCTVANDWTKLGPDPCTGIPKYLQVSYQCDVPTTTQMTTQHTATLKTTQQATTKKTTVSTTSSSTRTTQTTPATQTTSKISTTTKQATTQTTVPQTTLAPGVLSALVCQPNQKTLRCPPGDDIMIDTVFYGRTNQVVCNPGHKSFNNLNCIGGAKTNDTVHLYCDHQASCIVHADNSWLGVVDPCPGIPKYLQVTYHCKPLAPPTTLSTSQSTSTTSTTRPTTTSTTTTSTTSTPTTTSTTPTSTTTPSTTSTSTTTIPTTTPSTTSTTTTTPTSTSTTTTTPTSTSTTTTTPTTTSTTTTTPTTTSTTTTTPTTTSTTTTRPTTTSSTTTTPTTTSTTTTTTPTTTSTTPTTTSTSTSTTSTTPTTTSTSTSTTSTTPTTTTTTTPTSTTITTRAKTQMSTLPPYIPFKPPANAPSGAQVCHEYLISGQHGVPDSHLTASSSWNSHLPNDNNGPDRSRIFTTAYDYGNGTFYRGAWTSGIRDKNQYIQVEFMRPSLVRGVVSQGRHLNPLTLCCVQRVTEYKVSYSNDGINWQFVQDGSGHDKLFQGNIDQDSLVTHMLDCPFIARFLRLHPQSWHNQISLRFDVLGCQAITTDIGQCDPGWTELPGSNTCYLFSNNSLSWRDAKRMCQLNNGHLVDIQSIAERDFILQRISSSSVSMWWVGLNNIPRKDSKDYKWTDGQALDPKILQWKKGQPDNGGYGEHCAEFWNKQLNDDNCDLHRNFICEKNKYWKPPVNKPPIFVKTPPTMQSVKTTRVPSTLTTATTTTTPKPPPTVFIPLPTLPGVPYVSTGGNIFTTGCVGKLQDCYSRAEGDYQACKGCGHYVTCAASGMWNRPCPLNLKWDDNVKSCQFRSSSCSGP